jgi:hypothetical protein
MHGGSQYGTAAEGLAHSRCSRSKHGLYWAVALTEQKRVRELLAQSREPLKQMQAGRTVGATCLRFIEESLKCSEPSTNF